MTHETINEELADRLRVARSSRWAESLMQADPAGGDHSSAIRALLGSIADSMLSMAIIANEWHEAVGRPRTAASGSDDGLRSGELSEASTAVLAAARAVTDAFASRRFKINDPIVEEQLHRLSVAMERRDKIIARGETRERDDDDGYRSGQNTPRSPAS